MHILLALLIADRVTTSITIRPCLFIVCMRTASGGGLYLVSQRKYAHAAALYPRMLQSNVAAWERKGKGVVTTLWLLSGERSSCDGCLGEVRGRRV